MSSKSNKKQTEKATKKTSALDVSKDTISAAVGNYEKHPFFVKKVNEAKAYLTKVGLPKDLATKASK